MAQRKNLGAITIVVVLALAAAACGSSSKNAKSGSTSTTGASSRARGNVNGQLVLGALLPQSGDLSVIYKSLNTPLTMAVAEINAAGGVNGKPVVVKHADDGTSPDVASSSLDTLLTSGKVDAIVGPASSTTALGIIDKIKTNSVVACSGSTTSAALSVAGGAGGGYFFRTAPSDNLQGPALAQLVLSGNKHKIAILTRNDSYGTGFGSSLSKALTGGGADVVANVAYDPKSSDYRADVSKVAGKGADAIVVIGFNDDGGKVLKEMIAQNVGPKNVQVYTADGMQSSSLSKAVDPSNPAVVQGIKGTAPAAAPSGVTNPFIARFAATKIDTIFSSYYYDCANLIALAAQAAGSDDPAKIKAKMIAVSFGGTKCQNFKSCSDLLKAGTDIDYDGASGPVDLTSKHEPGNGVYDVWQYDAKGGYANVPGAAQIKING
ncbi:MAG: amino acid transporter substrate-binding protein [Actinomycetia bacterium]|nr:amino acid transporter substrate-binding protein [Actinomycetes bacterium]